MYNFFKSIYYFFFDRKGMTLLEVGNIHVITWYRRDHADRKKAIKESKKLLKKVYKYRKPPKYHISRIWKRVLSKHSSHCIDDDIKIYIKDMVSTEKENRSWAFYLVLFNCDLDFSKIVEKHPFLNISIYSQRKSILAEYVNHVVKAGRIRCPKETSDFLNNVNNNLRSEALDNENEEVEVCAWNCKKGFYTHEARCSECGSEAYLPVCFEKSNLKDAEKTFGNLLTAMSKTKGDEPNE